MLDIVQLKYIVAVEDAGSISKAAANMYVSQPYISKLISEVENEFGVVLFTREKNGMVPTSEGLLFLEHAKRVISEYDMMQSIFEEKDIDSLKISVQRSSHIFESFVQYLSVIRDDISKCKLEIEYREGTMFDVIDDITNRKAEIGIIGFRQIDAEQIYANLARKRINMTVLCHQKPYVVVSMNHPLAKKGKAVKISELYRYGTVRYGDRDKNLYKNLVSDSPIVDYNQLPFVIDVYDRGTQMGLLTFTDCFIFGISAFDAQQDIYHVISLPIDEDEDFTQKNSTIFALLKLDSWQHSDAANKFAECAKLYFARFDEIN